MIASKTTETIWFPEKKLIVTHISGDIEAADVDVWEKSLKLALSQIEDNGEFKIFCTDSRPLILPPIKNTGVSFLLPWRSMAERSDI